MLAGVTIEKTETVEYDPGIAVSIGHLPSSSRSRRSWAYQNREGAASLDACSIVRDSDAGRWRGA